VINIQTIADEETEKPAGFKSWTSNVASASVLFAHLSTVTLMNA